MILSYLFPYEVKFLARTSNTDRLSIKINSSDEKQKGYMWN